MATKKIALAKDFAKIADANIKAGKQLSKEQKVAKMNAIFEKGGSAKLAEAMIGPITIRINYEGIARQALVEDLVPRGEIRAYPILNDLPTAYSLNSNDGQVRISHVEGKQVIPQYGRIAAEWEVDRTDLELLAANPVEYADSMTVQQIAKQEDELVYNGLDLLIQDWQDLHAGDTSNLINTTSNVLTLDTVLDAQGQINAQQQDARVLIMNPADKLDLYRWDIVTVGLSFKDSYFAGYKQTTFGEWTILTAVTVPRGTVYVTNAADALGVFSTRYGLEATDDVTANNKFKIRKIFNELVAVLTMNNMGVVKIVKP